MSALCDLECRLKMESREEIEALRKDLERDIEGECDVLNSEWELEVERVREESELDNPNPNPNPNWR